MPPKFYAKYCIYNYFLSQYAVIVKKFSADKLNLSPGEQIILQNDDYACNALDRAAEIQGPLQVFLGIDPVGCGSGHGVSE